MNDQYGNTIDLASLEGEFQSAKEAWTPEEKPFDDTPVPDGKYQARVEKAEVTTSRNGNPMLKWQLEIVQGPHSRRRVWRQNMLMSAENFRWLLHDLNTCGVTIDRLPDLQDRVTDLLDLLLEISVKNGTDRDGRLSQKVYLNKRIGKWEPDPNSPTPAPAAGGGSGSGVAPDDDIPF